MIKFHKKHFIESILFDDVSPDQLRQSKYRFRNIHSIENKLTPSKYTQKRNLHVNTTNHFLQNPIFRNSCRIWRRFRHEYRKINYT